MAGNGGTFAGGHLTDGERTDPARRTAGQRREEIRARPGLYAHDICLDSRGSLYIGEVVWSAGGNKGAVAPGCHALQKFRV